MSLRQGRYDESIKLNQECLERMKIILGESHPDTLKVIFNLGHTHTGKLGDRKSVENDKSDKNGAYF